MSKPTHSPLPWRVYEGENELRIERVILENESGSAAERICGFHPSRQANAELIVRAVNAHESLVRVCQETDQFLAIFLTRFGCTDDDLVGWHKRVQSALAKAAPAERHADAK